MTAERLRSDYDSDADVLYLHVDGPAPAISEPGDDGLLLRHAVEDGRPCGVTVLGFRKDWKDSGERLAERVASFLRVERSLARRVLDRHSP